MTKWILLAILQKSLGIFWIQRKDYTVKL